MVEPSRANIYISLGHDEYKGIEAQMKSLCDPEASVETTHTSVDGFYHKSIALRFAGIRLEFHGPAVNAAEQDGLIINEHGQLILRQGEQEPFCDVLYSVRSADGQWHVPIRCGVIHRHPNEAHALGS